MNNIFFPIAPVATQPNCFFPVTSAPVMYTYPPGTPPQIFPDKQVIVNVRHQEAISIVPLGFLPVPHEQAYDLGVSYFEELFGIIPQINRFHLSNRGTLYVVELISPDIKIVFDRKGYRTEYTGGAYRKDSRPVVNGTSSTRPIRSASGELQYPENVAVDFYDEYFPFIRVSNSLVENRKFYIEMGYYRSRCSNGALYGRTTKMTFRHSYHVHDFSVIRDAAMRQLEYYRENVLQMAKKLWTLLSMPLTQDQMGEVAMDIFATVLQAKKTAERESILASIPELVAKYALEIGENMNAAFNVATDLLKVIRQKSFNSLRSEEACAAWLNRVTRKSFSLNHYLQQIKGIEDRLLTEQEEEVEETEGRG